MHPMFQPGQPYLYLELCAICLLISLLCETCDFCGPVENYLHVTYIKFVFTRVRIYKS